MAEQTTMRIVLLGKTGSGKSSLGNTLLGEKDTFKVSNAAISQTRLCQSETRTIKGRSIQLIDTPGLFDTDPYSSELSPEVLKCIIECAPGPHAFLLVIQVGRFTREEQAVVRLILKNFSEEVLKYTTVVFTHGDQLEDQCINEWVREKADLHDLVQRCRGRCHVFDNKYWKNSQDQYRNNQYQMEALLQTIDRTVRENGGGYYTNELLQKVQKEIEEATKKNKQSKAKDEVFKKMNELGFAALGSLLGAFFGTLAGPVGTAIGGALGFGVGAGLAAALEAGNWGLKKFY